MATSQQDREDTLLWDRLVVSQLVADADCAAKRSDGYCWVLLFCRVYSPIAQHRSFDSRNLPEMEHRLEALGYMFVLVADGIW